ncbi:hypothetical protein BVRB_1g009960 isoform A [Beta vulgaris subsp. vulgaris]|nr:hypothetical protein BVRB_1g009960 isoform A [Beta vulgaris subsp. vulgaris]
MGPRKKVKEVGRESSSQWMARHFDCTRDLLEDRYNDQRPNTSMCYEMMD